MDTTFDVATYVSIVSIFLFVIKVFVLSYDGVKRTSYNIRITNRETEQLFLNKASLANVVLRIFTYLYRKLPSIEKGNSLNEEDSTPLVFVA